MEYKAEEQYQSMVRAYESLHALATDIGNTAVIGPAAGDAAKTFFIECYHLKDWLKKDLRIKRPQDVEDFITNSPALSLAADLCNSLKHAGFDPNKNPRSGANLNQINLAHSLDIPANASASDEAGFIKMVKNPSDGDTITISRSIGRTRPVATATVVLTVGGKKHEALKIATQCVKDWDSFLSTQGIMFPKQPA
jgi:hypothetical protein